MWQNVFMYFSFFGPLPVLWGHSHPHLTLEETDLQRWGSLANVMWFLSSGSELELIFRPWRIALNLWSGICRNDRLASRPKLVKSQKPQQRGGNPLCEVVRNGLRPPKPSKSSPTQIRSAPFADSIFSSVSLRWETAAQSHSLTCVFLSVRDNVRE